MHGVIMDNIDPVEVRAFILGSTPKGAEVIDWKIIDTETEAGRKKKSIVATYRYKGEEFSTRFSLHSFRTSTAYRFSQMQKRDKELSWM